jgi:hypothetical protein
MPALLLSMLGVGRSVMTAVITWLSRRSLAEIGCIILALFAVVQTVRVSAEHRQNVKLKAQLHSCTIANQQTISNYRAAAEAARKADADNKARVEAEQAKISKEQSDEYEARIAAARATAQRLRQQLAQAHPGSPGAAPVPGVPAPTGQPPQGPSDGLSIDDRLTATEQGIQLDELIKWVKRQHDLKP